MIRLIFAAAALAATAAPAAAQNGRRMAAIFDNADANRDGSITRGEYAASRAARFDKMDRNKDGAISLADLPRMKRIADKMRPMLELTIDQADANRDGKATRAEMADSPMPIFERADSNGDGSLDKNEVAAARQRLAAARN